MREDLKNGDFVSLGMRILGPAATKGIVKVGAKAVKNVGNKLTGKFTGSRIGNKFANFKKWCKCNRFWGFCFIGETLVCTESGYVPIKEVPVGSLVYSMNEETGEIGLKEVEKVSRSSTHVIYTVQINGDVEINTTAYHQFYLDGEGWVGVIHLKITDRLLTKDGITLVTDIKKTRHEEAVPVFDFDIKDWVSYFVSKFQVYVHNKTECPSEDNFADMMSPEEAVRYNEYWKRNAPDFNTPNSKITHYKEHNGVIEKSTVIYDEFGRQKWRIDFNNHSRNDHSIPHLHERIYKNGYDLVKGLELRYDIWR